MDSTILLIDFNTNDDYEETFDISPKSMNPNIDFYDCFTTNDVRSSVDSNEQSTVQGVDDGFKSSFPITSMDTFSTLNTGSNLDEEFYDTMMSYDRKNNLSPPTIPYYFLESESEELPKPHELLVASKFLNGTSESNSLVEFEQLERKCDPEIEMKENDEPVGQILSVEYYREKAEYILEQKSSIASVHRKISMLSDSFHKWRMYAIRAKVLSRMAVVATVQHEDSLTRSCFVLWRNSLEMKFAMQRKVNAFIARRSLLTWQKWVSESQQYHKDQYITAVYYHNRQILQHTFQLWKENHRIRKADAYYDSHHKARVFKLWSLQLLKRKLQRRLARSHWIKLCQKKFLVKWKFRIQELESRRLMFAEKMRLFYLRYQWERIKKGISVEILLRSSAAHIDATCKINKLKYFFSLWQHQYKVECFKSYHAVRDHKFILKVHFEKWRKEQKKILLVHKMESWKKIKEKLLLSQYFKQWRGENDKQEVKNQAYEECLNILLQIKLARIFYIWRNNCNNENIAKRAVYANERKALARYFQFWILDWRRAKHLKMNQVVLIKKTFSFWREASQKVVLKRRIKLLKDENTLRKCVSHWIEYSTTSKQQREALVAYYGRHWLDVTQQRNIQRQILQAEMKTNEIITKVHFVKWLHRFNETRQRRLKMEQISDQHHRYCLNFKMFNIWVRQHTINGIVRNHQQAKGKKFLKSTFKKWRDVTQSDIKHQLDSFLERLTISDNSISFDIVHGHSLEYSTFSQTENSLVSMYKDSLENSFQQNQTSSTLDLSIFPLSSKTISLGKELDSTFRLALSQNNDQSEACISHHLLFSQGDINDVSSYNIELLDYNTDNDVDQDQIWGDDPITNHSDLQLHSSQTALSDDDLMLSNNVSFMSSNIHIPRSSVQPIWVDIWRKRYIHSRILSKQKRYSHGDVANLETSSLLSLSLMLRRNVNHQLSLNGSIRKENIDHRKVSLLFSTLQYWKHLDISAVFYAWLEYTQRKKYLQSMLEYISKKKNRYVKHTVFLAWNRRLYNIHAIAYFRQKSLTNQYFKNWKMYHLSQQSKASMQQIANAHHQESVTKLFFRIWRHQCHLELLLRGVNNSLDNDLAVIFDDFTTSKNKLKLESMFLTWNYSTQQMKLSKIHHENKLLERCIHNWCQLVTEKKMKNLTLRKFQQNSQMRKVFTFWKKRMHQDVKIQQVVKRKERETKNAIFSVWHDWTKTRLDRRLVQKTLSSRIENQWKHDVFTKWKEMHESRLKIRKDGDTLSISFKAWKKTILHTKADKHYVDNHCKQVFKSWKEKYVSRNEIQFLAKISCRRWKKLMEKTRKNESVLDVYFEERNLTIKKEYFLKWRQRTQQLLVSNSRKVNAAVHCTEKKKLRLIFVAWKEFKELKISQRKSVSQVQLCHSKSLLSSTFKTWRVSAMQQKKLSIIKHNLLWILVKESALHWKLKTKEHVLMSNQLNEMRCQMAAKHHTQYLVKYYFSLWTVNMKSERLKKIRMRLLERVYFKRWQTNVSAANMIVQIFQEKRCEMYWHKWRMAYVQESAMKAMQKRDEMNRLSLIFISWRRYSRFRHTVPNDIQTFQTAKWFKKWKKRKNS